MPLFQNEDKKSKAGGSKNYNRAFLHDPFLFFQQESSTRQRIRGRARRRESIRRRRREVKRSRVH
jgi:hypothetical protein